VIHEARDFSRVRFTKLSENPYNWQRFERVFVRRRIDTTLAERKLELSEKQKQMEKDEKQVKELDRRFRKIYEDNYGGKNDV